jgi:hypothetical protein
MVVDITLNASGSAKMTTPCQLTVEKIALIAFGLTCRSRPKRAALWLSRGRHRKGIRLRLTGIWITRIAVNPEAATLACQAWEDYKKDIAALPPGATTTSSKFSHVGGPGTELKKLLGRIGIKETPTCSCNSRAALMDRNGPDWCQQNRSLIIGWLAEEAAKRKVPFTNLPLPFNPAAAGKIVDFAIHRARKAISRALDNPPATPQN